MPGHIVAESAAQEGIDLLKIARAGGGGRQHHGQGYIAVGGVHLHTQQVKQFLGGTGAAGEDDNPVGQAHERLQPLLDIGQDNQLVHQRVG